MLIEALIGTAIIAIFGSKSERSASNDESDETSGRGSDGPSSDCNLYDGDGPSSGQTTLDGWM